MVELPESGTTDAQTKGLLSAPFPLPFRCSVSARPEPNFRWYYGGEDITESHGRYLVEPDYRDASEDLYHSTLTISGVTGKDLGDYMCKALNSRGWDELVLKLQEKSMLPFLFIFAVGAFDCKPLFCSKTQSSDEFAQSLNWTQFNYDWLGSGLRRWLQTDIHT